jgi:hypothetical protein
MHHAQGGAWRGNLDACNVRQYFQWLAEHSQDALTHFTGCHPPGGQHPSYTHRDALLGET